jgi:hypothetical protein
MHQTELVPDRVSVSSATAIVIAGVESKTLFREM